MKIEQQIQNAKHHFEPDYDADEFRNKIFRVITSEAEKRQVHRTPFKWTRAVIALSTIAIPLIVGFSYVYYQWSHVTFRFNQRPVTNTLGTSEIMNALNHPQQPNQKLTLAQARKLAGFPIREPSRIPGWTRIKRGGLGFKIPDTPSTNMNVDSRKAYVVYFDEYSNSKDRNIVVLQQINNIATAANHLPFARPKLNFPANSQQIHFGKSLGIFVPAQKSEENQLIVYDADSSQVTNISIIGGSEEEMKRIAQTYLTAPVK